MKVSSTPLAQVSAECQLRFNQVSLRSAIGARKRAERRFAVSFVALIIAQA